MVLRKSLVFILSSILTGIILTILMMSEGDYYFFETMGFILLFASPVILILGISVSVFSDFVLEHKYGKSRFILAFGIHIFFGLFFGIVLTYVGEGNVYFVASTIASVVVWITDELLKVKLKNTL